MTTLELNEQRVELARDILNIEDSALLNKIKRLISREQKKKFAIHEEECMAKEDILCGIDNAFKELQLNLEGKLEFKTIEEALDEL